jgi:hypothetical protein
VMLASAAAAVVLAAQEFGRVPVWKGVAP